MPTWFGWPNAYWYDETGAAASRELDRGRVGGSRDPVFLVETTFGHAGGSMGGECQNLAVHIRRSARRRPSWVPLRGLVTIIFRQLRYGFNNNDFAVWKFRTMHVIRPIVDPVEQATRDDARITRVGALLRRTSLDELPQFFNVLQGSMSIVGPRPHAVAHNVQFAEAVSDYYARHRVKPGITGWAQIHGYRGETDTQEKLEKRVEYDLYYIDNWSLMLDLRIIFVTLFVGFIHEHAY